MKGLFDRFRNTQQGNFVTVVSGLPRSGTSMMMKMLAAGGLDPITDHVREADADNPKGYYEFERVKKLPDGDIAWVEHAQGKSVKVITASWNTSRMTITTKSSSCAARWRRSSHLKRRC